MMNKTTTLTTKISLFDSHIYYSLKEAEISFEQTVQKEEKKKETFKTHNLNGNATLQTEKNCIFTKLGTKENIYDGY